MSATPVILPKLGLTMDEGKLLAWHKREGDKVEAGEILFEVETDKAAMEIEAPAAGYLRRITAREGDTVPVATTIALITTTADEVIEQPATGAGGMPVEAAAGAGGTPVEAAAVGGTPTGTSALGSASSRIAEPTVSTPSAASPPQTRLAPTSPSASSTDRVAASPALTDRVASSPAARRRAQELGVDLATVTGTGPGGRIQIEDVEKAATSAPTARAGEQRTALTRMRRAIAEHMTASFRDVPQFSISRDVDMTETDRARKAAGISYTDAIVAVCARALRAHPKLRSRFEGDAIVTSEAVHVGLAVAVDDGLLVPVIRDADQRPLAELRVERERVEAAARAGKLTAEMLSGATISVSNLGNFGVDRFTAIVNPPEAAILAVGRVRDQVVARDGVPVVRPVVTLTLSVDHRAVDGADAARFLADVAERLESGSLER